jgi:NAD(P)-dependent dehydrogenase (short-subunit alcohol dehydrogenase family)
MNHRAVNNGVSDKYDWENEIAVVTGGSDGIGQRIALLLAERGLKVAVLDIQPLKYEAPGNITFYRCDVTSSEAIADTAAAIRASLGEPTILINNAGVLRNKTLLDGTDADTRLVFEVNTLSHYRLTREFLPHMVKRNHGMVVTVASLAAYLVCSGMVDYSATKAAAVAFHEGLSTELVTRYDAPKVRTILMTQGIVRTDLIQCLNAEDSFLSPILEPETVAELLVRQIMTGCSGRVVVPGSIAFLAMNARSFPDWFQHGFRNRCETVTRLPVGPKA